MKHASSELRLGDVGFIEVEPCPECSAEPGSAHASWCLHEEIDDEVAGEA
ncbi:MAG: hypothetical protein ACR2K0_07315 [Acidimicrobiales bacterium]